MVRVTHSPGAAQALQRAIKDLKSKQVRVGWFDTAKYEDGTPVAYVATIHELGYPAGGIPARPMMRPTVQEKASEWKDTLAAGSRQVLNGGMTADQMLGQFGMMVAGNISETIAGIHKPALTDSTIAARDRKRKSPGVSVKPLVDTGLLIQSVSSKVEDV